MEKIDKLEVKYFFNTIKNTNNDPLENLDKEKLSYDKFELLNELLDDLWPVQQNITSREYKVRVLKKAINYFENEEAFDFFKELTDQAIKDKVFTKKSFFSMILLFLSKSYYLIILIIVAIYFFINLLRN